MRRVPVAALLAFVVVLTPACKKAKWQKFKPADSSFTIEVPGKPEQTTDVKQIPGGSLTIETMKASGGGVDVQVTWIDSPVAVPSRDYDRVLNPHKKMTVLGTVDSTPLAENPDNPARTFDGRPSAFDGLGGLSGTCRMRNALVGQRMYSFTVCKSGEEVPEVAANRILASFELSPP